MNCSLCQTDLKIDHRVRCVVPSLFTCAISLIVFPLRRCSVIHPRSLALPVHKSHCVSTACAGAFLTKHHTQLLLCQEREDTCKEQVCGLCRVQVIIKNVCCLWVCTCTPVFCVCLSAIHTPTTCLQTSFPFCLFCFVPADAGRPFMERCMRL